MDDTKPLYVQLGLSREDDIIVAYIPAEAEVMEEYPYRDGTREFVVFCQSGKVMDMLPLDSKGVKWWLVKKAARALCKDHIEPIKFCAAEDFSLKCLPDVPQPEGTKLALRCYSRGPWIKLPETKD